MIPSGAHHVRPKELKSEAGTKFDAGKTRYDLIPVSAVEGLARVLTFGANKYGDRNWEAGFSWGRAFAATMRHMWAWFGGENNDPETGMSHLWHAMCNIGFLIDFEAKQRGTDDRPR